MRRIEINIRKLCTICSGTGTPADNQGNLKVDRSGTPLRCAACSGDGWVKRWLPISDFLELADEALVQRLKDTQARADMILDAVRKQIKPGIANEKACDASE